MNDDFTEKHYESKFEIQLWTLIRKRAKQKDISYLAAAEEVVPEFSKTIRYRDEEYENAEVEKRGKEMAELARLEREQNT